MTQRGHIAYIKRKGFITGGGEKPVSEQALRRSNGNPTPYNLNYGEEKMRALQDQGFVLLEHEIKANDKMISRIIAED